MIKKGGNITSKTIINLLPPFVVVVGFLVVFVIVVVVVVVVGHGVNISSA